MLVRLLYASRAVDGIDEELVDAILERSQDNNRIHGITGVLCMDRQSDLFLQVLEGARPAVNTLFGNIMRDPRHHDVLLLDFAEIEAGVFCDDEPVETSLMIHALTRVQVAHAMTHGETDAEAVADRLVRRILRMVCRDGVELLEAG